MARRKKILSRHRWIVARQKYVESFKLDEGKETCWLGVEPPKAIYCMGSHWSLVDSF